VWSGSGRRRIDALLDRYEDPADVYRIRVPGHRSVRVSARPRLGDVQLAAYSAGAMALNDTKRRVAHSHRRGAAKERITVANATGRRRAFYVAVTPQGTRSLNARYRLTIG
jgi:hypothetical protein